MRLFTWRDKIFAFSTILGSIWFNFCFRLNIFTSRISNLLLPLGAKDRGLWILIYVWLRVKHYKTLKPNKQRPIHKPSHIYHPNKTILENIIKRFKNFIWKVYNWRNVLMRQYDFWCNNILHTPCKFQNTLKHNNLNDRET